MRNLPASSAAKLLAPEGPLKEPVNAKSGMTHAASREFIRNHFEEFVTRKNVEIGNVNFAPNFVDHGVDVPLGTPPGPARSNTSPEC
ncbi:MAG: hypothetical protein JWO71_920 [Candidatus Acidoferrum typicum]|nr:hypothetical protein [Candidatus Acidoferrum typicum]